jgi:DNA-binding response OmpR family regulator
MARVLALTGDLLFGSRVQGALAAAGHDVELIGGEARLRERLADADAPAPAVLVVDLTDAELDGVAVVRSLAGGGGLARACRGGWVRHGRRALAHGPRSG